MSSDRNPGTNGVITKLAAKRAIKAKFAILQADFAWEAASGASIPCQGEIP